MAVGDFNGDGQQDLAVANHTPIVSILLGDGAAHFGSPTSFPVGGTPYSIAVGDFNGDGEQDLAVANFNSNSVSILLGDGTGNFGGAINFGAGTNPRARLLWATLTATASKTWPWSTMLPAAYLSFFATAH